MGSRTRGALTLVGCLVVLAVAGGIALAAMNSYSSPTTTTGKVSVQVGATDPDGTVHLRTLDPIELASGESVFATGTSLITSSSELVGSSTLTGPPRAGTKLGCDVRVRTQQNSDPVVDIVRCAPTDAGSLG